MVPGALSLSPLRLRDKCRVFAGLSFSLPECLLSLEGLLAWGGGFENKGSPLECPLSTLPLLKPRRELLCPMSNLGGLRCDEVEVCLRLCFVSDDSKLSRDSQRAETGVQSGVLKIEPVLFIRRRPELEGILEPVGVEVLH